MATDIYCRVMHGGLVAVNQVEADKLSQFLGKEVKVAISQPRNIRFHKKYFALLGVGRDMADTQYNAEQFRAYVTVGAGYCEFVPHRAECLGLAQDLLVLAQKELNPGTESWNLILKIVDFIRDHKEGVVAIPKSISFAAMSEDEFERLYQDTISFICQNWVLDENDLNQMVNFL